MDELGEVNVTTGRCQSIGSVDLLVDVQHLKSLASDGLLDSQAQHTRDKCFNVATVTK